MRTARNLFNEFSNDDVPDVPVVKTAGRNSLLIEQRNELLVARIYWYRNFNTLRHELVMDALEREFHLTKIRIAELLQDNIETGRLLKGQKPTRNYFVNKWPHIKW